MDALIEAFGSYSIGSVIVLVAAFIFLYKIYRKAAQAIVEQHDTKKAQDEKIQKILDQESKYPEWRRQSIGIQEKLTDRLDNIEQSQKSVIRRLEEIEAERKRQKCNELRDRLLQAYRYYTNPDAEPTACVVGNGSECVLGHVRRLREKRRGRAYAHCCAACHESSGSDTDGRTG